jgi:hypothetical protein
MPKLLYLDDMRVPAIVDSALVTSYEEFRGLCSAAWGPAMGVIRSGFGCRGIRRL